MTFISDQFRAGTPAQSDPLEGTNTSRRRQQAQNALLQTQGWILRFGGRLAGSNACRNTAGAIKTSLQEACGAASSELFHTHPRAFNDFYRIDAVLYLVGLGLLFLNLPLPAGIIFLFMVTAAGLQFGWYVELYDWLYPRVECTNVSAVLEPRGDVRQQLIFSGHHDSALELNFLKRHQKLYGLKIIVPDAFRMLAAVTAWTWVAWQLFWGSSPPFLLSAKLMLVIGIYFVFTKFFLFGKDATPGAGDNLIACALLVELARYFGAKGLPAGQSILEHTRLIFVSFDAEESGTRGSRAWVRRHLAEIKALPTTALNIDSIYSVHDLQFLVSDLNSHIALDSVLAQTCVQLAEQAGYPASTVQMRFGGGATDAAEMSRAGIHATTMIAMPAGLVRDGLVYHTMQDTVDAVEPAAVEACLAIAEGLAIWLDKSL